LRRRRILFVASADGSGSGSSVSSSVRSHANDVIGAACASCQVHSLPVTADQTSSLYDPFPLFPRCSAVTKTISRPHGVYCASVTEVREPTPSAPRHRNVC
jgi:hypothetical protein